MIYKILKKQNNSKLCFVCGMHNACGLKTEFFETTTGEIIALLKPDQKHQSYPGRLHGGIAASLLDETIGRAISIGNSDQIWGVTVELSIKYKKSLPLNEQLIVIGRITRQGKIFSGSGEIYLENGDIGAAATGRYLMVTLDKITESEMDAENWFQHKKSDDPVEIEIPSAK